MPFVFTPFILGNILVRERIMLQSSKNDAEALIIDTSISAANGWCCFKKSQCLIKDIGFFER